MDINLVEILLDIQKEVATTKTMVTELAGPEGRVKRLEDDQRRQWWVTICVAPALALAHSVARKLGVQV